MFRVERRVGRVVEARVYGLASAEEVEQYRRAFAPFLLVSSPVLIADHRPVTIYPQEVTDKLTAIFRDLNRYWERVAIVISPTNATLGLQLRRVVRDSLSPSRQVFLDAASAVSFLGDVLSPPERSRVVSFLDDSSPVSSRPFSSQPISTRPLSSRR